jgi:polysaccharide biosynthesis transport protein
MSQQPNVIASTTETHGMGSADVLRIVRKRLWLILACFVVLGLGGTAMMLAWHYKWPGYVADGIIEVEPGQGQTNDLTRGFDTQMPLQLYQQYVESQVQAIRNPSILRAALEKLQSANAVTMFQGGGGPAALGKALQIGYIPNTQLIQVSLLARDPVQVKVIVQTVLDEYIEKLRHDRDVADSARKQGLEDEQKEQSRNVEKLSKDLSRFRDLSRVIGSDERNSEQLARLTSLIQQLTGHQAVLAEAGSSWSQFQRLQAEAEKSQDLRGILQAFPEIGEALRRDPAIAAMQSEVSRISQDLTGLQQRFGDKHETVVRTRTALQAAQNDLDAKQSEARNSLYGQQEAILKTRVERLRETERQMLEQIGEARKAAVEAARQAADYRVREGEYQRAANLLYTINDGLERMKISASMSRPNVRISRNPELPLEPSEPRLLLYIPATLVLGLLVGLALSFLLEVIDTRIRTPSDVARQVGTPLLGIIPDLTEDERLSLDTDLSQVAQATPHSLLAEAFRQFRTGLLFASDHPIKSVLVTSPNPGDGKSVVAANLAITMARGGSRTVLVEANFRRPSVARTFDVPEGVGLSNVLVNLNTLDEAVQATRIENLDVIVCGALPPSPAELLGSASMRQLVQTLMQRYDQVVLDGAPMLVVADNFLLAEMVDGVVMVYHAGQNTRGIALRAARQVGTLRARLLGSVLNRARATKGGYFRQAYQTYYDYSGAACPTDAVPVRKVVPLAAGPDDKADPSSKAAPKN